jgi:hypothetical protein
VKITVIPAIGVALSIAFSTFFAQEAISAEKAQRLCFVNSPAELIACQRGDSLYYRQPGLNHEKFLLDFAAQYCDTTVPIHIEFPYVLCVYSGIKEKINAQEIRKKEIESNMLSALRRLGKELGNPESGWKQISSEDEKRFLITSQGTGLAIQDGDEVTIRLRYPGKDGKPEKFDELKTFLVTKDDIGFRGLRQGSSLIMASNGKKKSFEFVDILLVTKLKP